MRKSRRNAASVLGWSLMAMLVAYIWLFALVSVVAAR
jgi:hypothetical protein